MSLEADAFKPITSDEAAADTVAPAKADRVPIVPVPDDAPPMTFKHPAFGKPTRVWEYRDRDGALLGYDARFEYVEDGRQAKDVLPVTYCQVGDKRGWRSKALPTPRPLFGLDRLAARPDAPVVIAEGAKSAEAAGALLPTHVAVSWSGGVNAINQSDWRALRGRDVLIWPDRDRHATIAGDEKPYDEQPGTIAAESIVTRIKADAAQVRVLDLTSFDCKDGWDADDALTDGWTPERAAAFVAEHASIIDSEAPGTVMPYGFERGVDGLYYVEGESKRLHICGNLKLLAKTRDVGSIGWGKLWEMRDDDGVSHRWAMPMTMVAGDGNSVREALLERGQFVSTSGPARQRLMEYVAKVDTPIRARAVTRVGWSLGAFALPHVTIGDTPTDRVIFQNGDAGVHPYGEAGALEEWQEHIGELAIGNSRMVFALSAAFVGPLLGPASEEGGGVNYVGASSSGKTTCARAASSVWGPPSFMRTWRATGNGLEGVAVQHSETLLCLDELSQLEPREAGQVAYMLGNGQGKVRATRSGSSRGAATWNILYLSTGEVGIADLVREGKPGKTAAAGQEVRILDLPADAGAGMGAFENIHGADNPAQFARSIKGAAERYYGTPAMTFVAELTILRDRVGDMVSASTADFINRHVPPDADGQVQRAGRRFALIAAAGELATALGVLPWARGEATNAASVMFRAWIDRRGGTGAAEDRNILQRLRLFIEQHGSSRFSPMIEPEDGLGRLILNRAGFWRSALVGGETVREYLFLREQFAEVFVGFDLAQVKRVLIAGALLIPDGANKATQSIRLPELGRQRCYVISLGSHIDGE